MFCDKSLWINIHVDPPGYLGYLDYFNKKFIVKYFRPNFPDLWKLWHAAPHVITTEEAAAVIVAVDAAVSATTTVSS